MSRSVVVLVSRESPVVNPAKLVRLAHSALAVLEATPRATLDDAARGRLARIWSGLVAELGSAVDEGVLAELTHLLPSFEGRLPTEGELRLAAAGIVGWLDGLSMSEQMSTWAASIEGAEQLATVWDSPSSQAPTERC